MTEKWGQRKDHRGGEPSPRTAMWSSHVVLGSGQSPCPEGRASGRDARTPHFHHILDGQQLISSLPQALPTGFRGTRNRSPAEGGHLMNRNHPWEESELIQQKEPARVSKQEKEVKRGEFYKAVCRLGRGEERGGQYPGGMCGLSASLL